MKDYFEYKTPEEIALDRLILKENIHEACWLIGTIIVIALGAWIFLHETPDQMSGEYDLAVAEEAEVAE